MTTHNAPKRAKNLEEFLGMSGKFLTEEGHQAGLAFQPRSTDVIISPFAKSGTTWLQQIAHGLRTRGSMDFEEITAVTPWIEVAQDYGWDLEAEQIAAPRLFKSHCTWDEIPKGGRYICAIRNPHDVAVSFYRFLEGWWFETDSISLEEFIHARVTHAPAEKGYWHHLISWWEQRENENVLLLCFEDMKTDLPATVQTIAQFMGITLDDELLDIVVRQSSKGFMLAHQSHFDDHLIQTQFERHGGPPSDLNTAKITAGATNHKRYQLSPAIKDELDAIWHKMIYTQFGFKDYAALRTAIMQLQSGE